MNSNQRNPILLAAAAIAGVPILAFAVSVAVAQSFSIEGKTTSGGGGVSSGGPFSVSGTTSGQPDAANSSGGPYAFYGGFWPIVSLIQTPHAPPIAFRRTPGGSLQVFWPLPGEGWRLTSTTDLTNWTNIPPTSYGQDAVSRFFNVPNPGSIRFFSLYRPPPIAP